MDEKRKKRYSDKFAFLNHYHNLLTTWIQESDFQDLVQTNNYEKIYAIYHAAQLMIEVLADISAMIIKDLSIDPKDDYTNFQVLMRENIIFNDLFLILKKFNGLRNRIVHNYNGLVDEIVWQTLKENLHSIPLFQEVIKEWLTTQ